MSGLRAGAQLCNELLEQVAAMSVVSRCEIQPRRSDWLARLRVECEATALRLRSPDRDVASQAAVDVMNAVWPRSVPPEVADGEPSWWSTPLGALVREASRP